MREFLRENESDLNQMCLKALKQVGRKPDDEALYWLQLVNWALETGELSLEPDRADAMRSFLGLLEREEPAFVMRFMEREDVRDPESEEVQVAEVKDWEPVDLAAQILDHLDSRMSAELEDYPSPRVED